ncbi:Patatin-like phospholipase [Singulisphaera sp. GP187]|uniref:patatin-like phospholipase family protein n=1 Tax=Singulisphaera sp. GP187 TaxID=1882752 RepID=UPI00092733FA|nr:patatin-like phospholipase family protein [Singulisphaera sp. GP187]SIO59461.1 Patatin-like phospholipase [Singulisphaera sp. GP187]
MDDFQTVLAFLVLAGLVFVYRELLGSLLRFLADHPSQAAILIVLYAIVYGQIGNAIGIPYLFWNEEPVTRLLAATESTLLLAIIGISSYFLLDEDQHQVGMQRVADFLSRWSFKWRWAFLERGRDEAPTAWELTRFLRLMRLPFLTVLVLPAVLPGAWFCSGVPKYAPVVDAQRQQHAWFHGLPDVTRNPWAWLVGVAIWCGGVALGLGMIKLGIYTFPWVTRKLSRPLVDALSPWTEARIADATDPTSALRRRKRVTMVTFFLVMITVYGLSALTLFYDFDAPLPWFQSVGYRGLSPAFCICVLLGMASLTAAVVSLVRWRQRVVLMLGIFVWIGLANHNDFKLRFENLSYATRATLVNEEANFGDDTPDKHLASNDLALKNWLAYIHEREGADKPKLVVVCVSGGAIRAGYWSTVVLSRLENTAELGQFHDHVRMISGASGGMVGASYYVAWLRSGRKFDLPRSIPFQSLWPVARHITLRDPVKMFLPFRVGDDRGMALERDWRGLEDLPFADLRNDEGAGRLPSLIFSPMTVDDGRRLLISNLDLRRLDTPTGVPPRAMAQNRAAALSEDETAGNELRPYSLSATEYYKKFAAQDRGLRLATAARMSATFPFVSPAVNLPSDPPLRVVDAGYYDNYGVDVAAAWISMNREWLADHCSGVLLVQIRDSVSRRDRLGYPLPVASAMEKALKGFQFFTSVTDGFLAARVSSSMFRNDAQVAALCDVFQRLTNNKAFFTTVIFENSANVTIDDKEHWPDQDDSDPSQLVTTEVAMSWYLTVAEQRAMDRAIPSEAAAVATFGEEHQEERRLARLKNLKAAASESNQNARRQAYLYLQYERAMNYERLQSLKRWWKNDYSPLAGVHSASE